MIKTTETRKYDLEDRTLEFGRLKTYLKYLSHHAYALIGGDSILEELISILERNHSIPIHGNPDLFDRKYEIFTIDDARELKTIHSMRPVHDSGKKIFIISMNGVTNEAQNAMLKLLEEPADYAHFFLIIPSEHLLLPTVKSRLSIINFAGKKGEAERVKGEVKSTGAEFDNGAKKFLEASIAKRLEMVKKLVDDITKEKATKQDAITFLNQVERAVYSGVGVMKGKSALEAIEKARNYAGDRAPSLKMLLEFVALNI